MLHLGVDEPSLHRQALVVMVFSGGSGIAVVGTGTGVVDRKVRMQVARYVSSEALGTTVVVLEVRGRQDWHMVVVMVVTEAVVVMVVLREWW